MITISPEDIKALVKRLGEACLKGEQHALADIQPPGFSHEYADKALRDAYLIGLNKQAKAMQGEAE